jgi:ethanolamine utilization microcompartment shell protein EutS
MSNSTSKFNIVASSDLDYEKMVINLNYDNNLVAILNCDKEINEIEIKIYDRYKGIVIWEFDFQSFMTALKLASEKLKKLMDKWSGLG